MQDSNILIDPITTNGLSSSTAIDMSPITNNNSYCASAPGKVILFGEHSVVYGQPAIAAALSDLRIYVHIQISTIQNTIPISNEIMDNRLIRICMPDLPQSIDVTFPIESFITIQDQIHSPPTQQCTDHIESFIQSYGPDSIINNKHSIHAILPVLYLLSQLAPNLHNLVNCHITVRSKDLPVGAGLGSSAAFGVACTAAFIQWKYATISTTTTDGNIQWPILCTQIPTPDMINDINQYAYYSEMLLHGRPSGIDNTVSSHGGIISFTRSHHEVSFNPISLKSSSSSSSKGGTNHHNNNPLHILLVDTHVPRQTKQLVANVRTLHDQFPTIITPILEAMGQIANTFCNIITTTTTTTTGTINDTTHNNNNNNSILTLVRTNQSLLCALGVSHPSLDHICSIVNHEEYSKNAAAKLTGAGGGGCAMILLQPYPSKDMTDLQRDIIAKIQTTSHTTEHQYTFLSSSVGGVGVLFVPMKEYETLFMS